MVPSRSVRVQVRGGGGRLEVHRGEQELALTFDGDPVALLGPDPDDADATVLLRAHDLAPLDGCVDAVEADALGGPLVEALRPVLELLAEGAWRITVEPDVDLLDAFRTPAAPWEGLVRVPHDAPPLVATTSHEALDPRAVRAARRRLDRGGRPVVVAVGDEAAAFVVAGHAVLAALRPSDPPPPLVRLDAITPRPMTADQVADLVVSAYTHLGELAAARLLAARSADDAAAS